MTAEEKALRRYTKETLKKRNIFNLEAEDEDLLTHGGKALDANDDFQESDLESQSDAGSLKRKRPDGVNSEPVEEPERKKTKTEVMQEIIKKSKLHKYERQQAKEEEDVMRIELDAELTDVRAALGAFEAAIKDREMPKVVKSVAPAENMHPDRAAILNGTDIDADKAYDRQLREMGQAPRARPAPRTKTDDELRQEGEARAKEHEESLLKRMAGVDEDYKEQMPMENEPDENDDDDDAGEFGFSGVRHSRPEGIDDEDDFILEDGFIDQGSEAASEASELLSSEDELLLSDAESDRGTSVPKVSCPGNLDDVRKLLGELPYSEYHETIRQIRLQNDTSLSADNLQRLDNFAAALVEYLVEMPTRDPRPSAATLDVVIRHIHSLAKKHTGPVSLAFRAHLQRMHDEKSMGAGDLVVLAAVGAIYPPSDHFHQIATPAMLLMARWLGLTAPRTAQELNTGAYLGALCLRYQALAKRYVPELVRFTLLALRSAHPRELLEPHVANALAMADAWSATPAFIEIFSPDLLSALQSLGDAVAGARPAAIRLQVHLSQARQARRNLELHHHRPLPIRTAAPKFEEGFDGGKHYDPDAARAESARLRKEYKRERKGAVRELRRDANFLARAALRDKRERDGAYEVKYRRIVSEIQGEEGRERNAYEREKRMRKKRR
jgi:nucleolar protein 14